MSHETGLRFHNIAGSGTLIGVDSTDSAQKTDPSGELGYTPFDAADVDTDSTLAANSDTKVASQKAIKTYIAGQSSVDPFKKKWLNASSPMLKRYTLFAVNGGQCTNNNIIGQRTYYPFIVEETKQFTGLELRVTASVAGAKIRLALYTTTDNALIAASRYSENVPTTVIYESGEVASATAGDLIFLFPSPITLTANTVYALGIVANGSPATSIMFIPSSACRSVFTTTVTGASTSSLNFLVGIGAYGAQPISFMSTGTENTSTAFINTPAVSSGFTLSHNTESRLPYINLLYA